MPPSPANRRAGADLLAQLTANLAAGPDYETDVGPPTPFESPVRAIAIV